MPRTPSTADFDEHDWDAVSELMSSGRTRTQAIREVRDTKDEEAEIERARAKEN